MKIWSLSDKIKWNFFQAVAVSVLLYGLHQLDVNKTHEEKARWELHKNAMCCFQQIFEPKLHKRAAVWPLTSHLKNHPSKANKILVK